MAGENNRDSPSTHRNRNAIASMSPDSRARNTIPNSAFHSSQTRQMPPPPPMARKHHHQAPGANAITYGLPLPTQYPSTMQPAPMPGTHLTQPFEFQQLAYTPSNYLPQYAPQPVYQPQYGYTQQQGYGLQAQQYNSQYFSSPPQFSGLGSASQQYAPPPYGYPQQQLFSNSPHAGHGWNAPRMPQFSHYLLPASASPGGLLSSRTQGDNNLISLHGPGLPQVQVAGDSLAIEQLKRDVEENRIMVQQDLPEANSHAVRMSAQCHELVGDLLEIDGNRCFKLHQLSPAELAEYDLTPKDLEIDETDTVRHLGIPPFKEDIVDKALVFLNAMSRYRHHNKPGKFQVWQVCVTTHHAGSRRAQLFKKRDAVDPKHTLHLYREIISRGYDYMESWKGFVLAPGAPEPKPVCHPTSMTSKAHQQNHSSSTPDQEGQASESEGDEPDSAARAISNSRTNGALMAAVSAVRNISPGELLSRKLKGFEGISNPDRDTRARFPAHLTDEQLLAGHVHPEDIVGTLLLDLAKRNSNKKIAAHVVALYNVLPGSRNKSMNANCITKRITLALQAQAAAQGESYEDLKAQFDAERKANRAFAKEETKRDASVRATPVRRGRKRKAAAEYEEPVQQSRKSKTAVKTESDGELEEEIRDLQEMERPAKRSRKSKQSIVKRELDVEAEEEDDGPPVKKTRRSAVVEIAVDAPRSLRSRKSVVSYASMEAAADKIKKETEDEGEEAEEHEAVGMMDGDDSDGSEFEGSDDDED